MINKPESCRFDGSEPYAVWKQRAEKNLKALLGIEELLQQRPPLNPRSLWKRETELGTIEKIMFQTEEGIENRIYLCLPKGAKPPYRSFICMQGHSTGMHVSLGVEWKDEKTPYKVEGDRGFAIDCMKFGIAAICLEQRAMGENSTDPEHKPSCYEPAMRALLRGRTILGERVYDVDRVIDYLESRGDFDMTHLGVMGNSGGGTTSMFAGALLPRLTHVMPSCSFSSFAGSIGAMYHCSCNYIPGLYLYGESADVLGLTAPRDLVIVNGAQDNIFPLTDANREFARLEKIYEAAGAKGKCHHVVGPEGHRFYADPAWKVMLPLFMN